MSLKRGFMKKFFIFGAASLLAFSMMGCEKKGTIEGVVLDPFTKKPVEMPTVWMDSTIFGTQTSKYEFKKELREGKFKFQKVPAGSYLIKARRNKYVLTQQKVTTTPENPNATVTLYSYSDQVDPGLYIGSAEGPQKVQNEWVLWSSKCAESVTAYRQTFVEDKNASALDGAKSKKKKKKKADLKITPLPAPKVVDSDFKMFYRNMNSVTVPIVATSYLTEVGNVSDHKDCAGFTETEKKGVFVQKDKALELKVEYIAEGLFEISGTLPKGKQILYLSQDGKALQNYYFEVK